MKEIKDMLLEMQQKIIDEIERERVQSASAITNDIGDSIDHATAERDRELFQLLGERDRLKLDRIEQALERIEDDSYGTCEECGTKISKKRLMAMPFTEFCIDCKAEIERTRGKDGPALDQMQGRFMDTEQEDL